MCGKTRLGSRNWHPDRGGKMIRKFSKTLFATTLSLIILAATATSALAQPLSGTGPTTTPTRTTTRLSTTTRDNPRVETNPYKAERDAIERIRAKSFPSLEATYVVLGKATKDYNCIAWSLKITTQWVWPGAGQADFDKLDGQYGFRRATKLDYSLEPGIEKIVLYGKKVNGKWEMTHQARDRKSVV